jgi:isocitrate lyase
MVSPYRWDGIERPYIKEEVLSLRGSKKIEYTLAKDGANKLWELLHEKDAVRSLGALTGNQAVQQVKAGLKAIYLSGWQVAADANLAGDMYPDQSLYPANSVPAVVKKINKAFQRADQLESVEGGVMHDYYVPIVADAEAGFGGPLNAYELMKGMIEAGAAGVHFEDQLASEKKCGHMGGKVLVPTANSAKLITSDVDERDHPFMTGERTPEGFYKITGGLDMGIARGLAYAPYADLLWLETSTPSLEEAQKFADAIHAKFPGKLLAYNCSPSFNWEKHLDKETIAKFQKELEKMGYKFQFVTLAGFHALNHSMFTLAKDYEKTGMAAYSALQQKEFGEIDNGFTAVKHQREVGTGYFDKISQIVSDGDSSTLALKGSTEEEQF